VLLRAADGARSRDRNGSGSGSGEVSQLPGVRDRVWMAARPLDQYDQHFVTPEVRIRQDEWNLVYLSRAW
jgi:hypothetical protein